MIQNTDDMEKFHADFSRCYQEYKRARRAARRRQMVFLFLLAGYLTMGVILGPLLKAAIKWLLRLLS